MYTDIPVFTQREPPVKPRRFCQAQYYNEFYRYYQELQDIGKATRKLAAAQNLDVSTQAKYRKLHQNFYNYLHRQDLLMYQPKAKVEEDSCDLCQLMRANKNKTLTKQKRMAHIAELTQKLYQATDGEIVAFSKYLESKIQTH